MPSDDVGELKQTVGRPLAAQRSVKDELLENLAALLENGLTAFSQIVGSDTRCCFRSWSTRFCRATIHSAGPLGRREPRAAPARDAARRRDPDSRGQRCERNPLPPPISKYGRAAADEPAAPRRSPGCRRYFALTWRSWRPPDVTVADIIGERRPPSSGARRARALRTS